MKKCQVCGKENEKVFNSKKFNMILCDKHYTQMNRYGRIKERTLFDVNEIKIYDDHAEIVLYNKQGIERARTLIDIEDVEKVKNHRWTLDTSNYVLKAGTHIRLHRYLLNASDDYVVDHRNLNTLDNRKSNIRICSRQENNLNVGLKANNTSGIKGVSWDKSINKWVAEVMLNKKKVYIQKFDSLSDAQKCVMQAREKYHKEFVNHG